MIPKSGSGLAVTKNLGGAGASSDKRLVQLHKPHLGGVDSLRPIAARKLWARIISRLGMQFDPKA